MNTSDEQSIPSDNRSPVKFYLFLICAIVSVCCTFFLFYHFFSNIQLRRSIHHHVIFLLLFITLLTILIPISFSIYFFSNGHALITTNQFCSLWNYFQYSFSFTNLCLMTFTCFERHLFIFHSKLYRLKIHRIFLHYVPMISCLIYPILFYSLAIFVTPCIPAYDYGYIFCLWPCYYNDGYWLGYYDLIVNNCLTNFLIPFLSIVLLLRVMKQKHRMRQKLFKWRRDRKMLIQLTIISSLYIIFWLPNNLVSVIEVSYNFILLNIY
jgi:hypothetical protein